MTIWRGTGGGGNATTDAEVNLLTALTTQSTASATASGVSATQAATSATNASNSASAASTSATNASNSATAASGSASTASTQATNASNSASAASTSASNAASSLASMNKDGSGGVPGLTLFKLNMRNALNTLTSFFTNSNTVARTYTLPDKDGTVAMTVDITGTNTGTNTGDQTASTVSNTPVGTISSTTVQGAINEIVSDLTASSGASLVGYMPAGTGAIPRNIQSKLRESENVLDYGADKTGATDSSTAVQLALTAAKAGNKQLYFPAGTYLVQSALYINGGITVHGDGITATTITRTSLAATVINAINVFAVFYVEGGWNHIADMSLVGTGITGTVSGVQFGANIAAKGSIKNMAINGMLNGIVETNGVFLTTFDNVQVVSGGYGFRFDSAWQKTSLTFNQCYAVNTGPAYLMSLVDYSVINSCAADNCNWLGISANPYGTGYGNPADSRGVYNFNQCDLTITDSGAEGSYGNGVFSFANSVVTVNNMFSYDCRSLFVPNYAAYPNYAVGPIQCTTAGNELTIGNAFNRVWTNTAVSTGYPAKPIAALVAFNYDEVVLGILQKVQVTVNNQLTSESAKVFAGMGPIGRNCLNTGAAAKGPVMSVVQSGNTTLTAYVDTLLIFNTKEIDTDVCYDTTNKRFVPTVAGYYKIDAAGRYRATSGVPDFRMSCYKNGAVYKEGSAVITASGDIGAVVSCLVYLNGLTDYVDIRGFTTNASVCVVIALPQWSYFQAALVRTA